MIGIEDVLVVESDGTRLIAVQRTDLDLDSETDTRARELALLDNRTGEVNLDWEHDELKAIAEDGVGRLVPRLPHGGLPSTLG